jgi:hypothetical protein
MLKSRYSGVKAGMLGACLGKRAISRGIRLKIQRGRFFESRSKPKANPAVPGKREESIIVAGPYNEIMGIVKIISVRKPILDCHATYKISVHNRFDLQTLKVRRFAQVNPLKCWPIIPKNCSSSTLPAGPIF